MAMVKIVCEMCNSNEFAKVDGMLVCQCCGTKYSVEEAKKLMVEDAGSAQDAMLVGNSSQVSKYLEAARRAKAKENWADTERYYSLVEENDPTNMEAIFYSAYAKVRSSFMVNDIFSREVAFQVLSNSIHILSNNFDTTKCDESVAMLKQITKDVGDLRFCNFVYTETTRTDGFGNTSKSDDKNKTKKLALDLEGELFKVLKEIEQKVIAVNNKVALREILYMQVSAIIPFTTLRDPRDVESQIHNIKIGMGIEARIRILDPTYKGVFSQAEIDRYKQYEASMQRAKITDWCVAIAVIILAFIIFYNIF
jgi:uncharacterized Zn finger protein (UPF0148 family)